VATLSGDISINQGWSKARSPLHFEIAT